MSSTLLDAFDRPVTVRVRGLDVRVGEFRIRDLVDLQAWIRDHSWDPWDVPDAGDVETALALVVVHADAWPPPLGTEVAERALADVAEAYADELARVILRRHNDLSREAAAAVGRSARADVLPWIRIQDAAYAIRPDLTAGRLLNRRDGAAEEPGGDGPDWALSVAALVLGSEDRRGLSFAEAEDLTLSQYRLLCRAHRDERGRLKLANAERPRERARPGEPWKAAKARWAARLDRATTILEAHYSGSASTNGKADPDG